MSAYSDSGRIAAVRDALFDTQAPIFVARFETYNQLVVGTLGRRPVGPIKAALQRRLLDRGITAAIRVVQHDPVKLGKIRSLERLLGKTGRGALVFDRTKALERAEAVLNFGQRLRARLGREVEGLFFQSDRRTLFVLTDGKSISSGAARERVAQQIVEVEQQWRDALTLDGFELSVRIGVAVPSGLEVIAVDQRTVRSTMLRLLSERKLGRWGAAVIGTLAGAAITMPASATDLPIVDTQTALQQLGQPAVDEPNFTVTGLAGVARDPVLFDHLWAGLGAKATIPLGERFGAQLDLGIATDTYYGAGLHFFARDPAMGLVGIVGSAENQYGVSMNRVGVELEYYINDKFTVSARAGYQTGTAPNGVFGRLDVKFYPDPNFAITAGAELQPSWILARGGFEWRPAADALPNMSISGDASVTSTGNYRAMFGLHFQLGGSERLVDRDRKSDPGTAIWNQIDVSSAAYGGGGPL